MDRLSHACLLLWSRFEDGNVDAAAHALDSLDLLQRHAGSTRGATGRRGPFAAQPRDGNLRVFRPR